jgi:hypothetical protein
MVTKMIAAFEEKNHTSVDTACYQPREKVALGSCPFSCGCTSVEEKTEEAANEYA